MANSFVEKRKFKRYNAADVIIVIFENKKLGQLLNISKNGIAIHIYNIDLESIPKKFNASLLTESNGFLVEDFPLDLVRKELISSSSIKIVAAQFNTVDTDKLNKIKEYISDLS